MFLTKLMTSSKHTLIAFMRLLTSIVNIPWYCLIIDYSLTNDEKNPLDINTGLTVLYLSLIKNNSQ